MPVFDQKLGFFEKRLDIFNLKKLQFCCRMSFLHLRCILNKFIGRKISRASCMEAGRLVH